MTKSSFHGKWVFFFLSITVLSFPVTGFAQEDVSKFPTKLITYISPFSAGSPPDLSMRLISKEAEKFLGQPIIVVNRLGVVGTIGVAAVAAAIPNGYTIGYAPHSAVFVIPHLQKLSYHPVADLKMIMQFGSLNTGVIINAESPLKSFKDIITFARENPGKLTYGTGGTNSLQSVIMEEIAKREKVQFMHIPFKSTLEAQTALLGGHILVAAGDFNYSFVESGKTRLVLLFREERSAEYPQTPILKDVGYDITVPAVLNVAGPKGLPDEIVRKLEDAFTRAMKEPAFVNGMKDLRLPIEYRNSRDLNAYVVHNYATYGRMLKHMAFKEETGAIGK